MSETHTLTAKEVVRLVRSSNSWDSAIRLVELYGEIEAGKARLQSYDEIVASLNKITSKKRETQDHV